MKQNPQWHHIDSSLVDRFEIVSFTAVSLFKWGSTRVLWMCDIMYARLHVQMFPCVCCRLYVRGY